MTNDEAYAKLIERKCSREGALSFLAYAYQAYAYQAQYVGSWKELFVNDIETLTFGGSEAAKAIAMDVFRDAGIDPMRISFSQPEAGTSP